MDPLLCLFFLTLLVSARGWEGRLVFNEDFHGESLRKFIWDTEEGCEGFYSVFMKIVDSVI